MSNRKHITQSGPNAGKWERCKAEQKCRNGGFHVSNQTLVAVQEWKSSQTGSPVPQSELNQQDILNFVELDERTQRKFVSKTMFDSVSLTGVRMENNNTEPFTPKVVHSEQTLKDVSIVDNYMDEALDYHNKGLFSLSDQEYGNFKKRSKEAEDRGSVPVGYTEWMSECYNQVKASSGDQRSWTRYVTGMVGDRLETTLKQGKPMPTTAELKEWADEKLTQASAISKLEGKNKDRAVGKIAHEIKRSARGNPVELKAKKLISVINGFFDGVNKKVTSEDNFLDENTTPTPAQKSSVSNRGNDDKTKIKTARKNADQYLKDIKNSVISSEDKAKVKVAQKVADQYFKDIKKKEKLQKAIRKHNGGRLPRGVGQMNLTALEAEAKRRGLNF